MWQWQKLGPIFNPADHGIDWMNHYGQCPSTLVYDEFVRVFFCTRPPPDELNRTVSRCGFVDLARGDLTKILAVSPVPVLPLGGRGCFDEFGTYPVSVIRHGGEVRLYYGGVTRCESVKFDVAIGCAVSTDDGHSFTKMGTGPVLSSYLNEPFVISSPKIKYFNDNWHLFYISGTTWLDQSKSPEVVYKIRHAKSNDGIDWIRTGVNIIPDKIKHNESQASADVYYANDKYHMFFSYRHSVDFRNQAKGYRIGYAVSTDLIHWKRSDSRVGITVSDSGWDSEMIAYPHVFALDGQVYMLYQGNGFGIDGFGLARLEGELA
ncbi:MAG: glycosylase [Candidatus Pacebacteria bacterium]|nr:glycosylase [Candidatus Paceibacterota bacterium]